jgi:hypothetical protein
MAYKLPTRKKYIRPVQDPTTGQSFTSGSIYNVMTSSEKLSRQRLISKTPAGSDALDNSLAVLHAFDISVVEETKNTVYTLLEGRGLEMQNLEQIEETRDFNPNRLKIEKMSNLKGKKIKLSKVFKQEGVDPINEPDTCKADALKIPPKVISNVIEMTDDFLSFSTIPLQVRTLK